jgi:hypothetical protein
VAARIIRKSDAENADGDNQRESRPRSVRDALVVKNLANEVASLGDSRSIAAETPGRPRLFVNQPRTVGIEFRQSF